MVYRRKKFGQLQQVLAQVSQDTLNSLMMVVKAKGGHVAFRLN